MLRQNTRNGKIEELQLQGMIIYHCKETEVAGCVVSGAVLSLLELC